MVKAARVCVRPLCDRGGTFVLNDNQLEQIIGLRRRLHACPERSGQERQTLQGVIREFGFAENDLKTLNFNVDPEYEGYQEGNVYKQKFKGYRYYHQLKLEFPSDNERLGKVLYALAKSGLTPEFNISFFVSDPESVRNAVRSVLEITRKVEETAPAALTAS